jgi:hypothetical protein
LCSLCWNRFGIDKIRRKGQNEHVLKPRYLPDPERLSTLAATILLAFTVSRLARLPEYDFSLQLPGFFLSLPLNANTVIALLVGGLTASGANWLLHDHPALRGSAANDGTVKGSTFQHWLLPALTALVIGVPLFQLPLSLLWWAVLAVGCGVLVLVLVAEYIAVDVEDVRYPIAGAALTAVSFALFLGLAIFLKVGGLRLFQVGPALGLAAVLVSLRTFQLRLPGEWKFEESIIVGLIVLQMSAALHYWPLSPISFGLAVLAPTYALCSLVSGLLEGVSWRQALLEPVIVLVFLWGSAIWFR